MALIINGKIIKEITEESTGGGGGSTYNFLIPLVEDTNNNVSLNIDNDKIIINQSQKLTIAPKQFMEYRDYITSIETGNEMNIGAMLLGDKINNNTTMIINLVSSDWATYPTECSVQFQWNKNGDDSQGWLKLIVDWKQDNSQRTIFIQHFENGNFNTHTFFNDWGDDEGPFQIFAEGGNYWELDAITGDNANDYTGMDLFLVNHNMYVIEDSTTTTQEQYNRNFVYSVNWNITGGTGTQSQYNATDNEFRQIEDFSFLFDVITFRFCYVTARFKQGSQYIINYVIISGN